MNRRNSQPDPWRQSIYDELHYLAKQALKAESPGHSLQPTLLVNDAYMRLLSQNNVCLDDRVAVMAAGAKIIRRLLVDYARRRKTQKRGGQHGRGMSLSIPIADDNRESDMLNLNEAIEALSQSNSRSAEVVELKFFGGLTVKEIASTLGVSTRTVDDDWRFARAWLHRELAKEK